MNKTISMSIRVTPQEIENIRKAAQMEAYSSYSEYVRRTILLETKRVLDRARNTIEQTKTDKESK